MTKLDMWTMIKFVIFSFFIPLPVCRGCNDCLPLQCCEHGICVSRKQPGEICSSHECCPDAYECNQHQTSDLIQTCVPVKANKVSRTVVSKLFGAERASILPGAVLNEKINPHLGGSESRPPDDLNTGISRFPEKIQPIPELILRGKNPRKHGLDSSSGNDIVMADIAKLILENKGFWAFNSNDLPTFYPLPGILDHLTSEHRNLSYKELLKGHQIPNLINAGSYSGDGIAVLDTPNLVPWRNAFLIFDPNNFTSFFRLPKVPDLLTSKNRNVLYEVLHDKNSTPAKEDLPSWDDILASDTEKVAPEKIGFLVFEPIANNRLFWKLVKKILSIPKKMMKLIKQRRRKETNFPLGEGVVWGNTEMVPISQAVIAYIPSNLTMPLQLPEILDILHTGNSSVAYKKHDEIPLSSRITKILRRKRPFEFGSTDNVVKNDERRGTEVDTEINSIPKQTKRRMNTTSTRQTGNKQENLIQKKQTVIEEEVDVSGNEKNSILNIDTTKKNKDHLLGQKHINQPASVKADILGQNDNQQPKQSKPAVSRPIHNPRSTSVEGDDLEHTRNHQLALKEADAPRLSFVNQVAPTEPNASEQSQDRQPVMSITSDVSRQSQDRQNTTSITSGVSGQDRQPTTSISSDVSGQSQNSQPTSITTDVSGQSQYRQSSKIKASVSEKPKDHQSAPVTSDVSRHDRNHQPAALKNEQLFVKNDLYSSDKSRLPPRHNEKHASIQEGSREDNASEITDRTLVSQPVIPGEKTERPEEGEYEYYIEYVDYEDGEDDVKK